MQNGVSTCWVWACCARACVVVMMLGFGGSIAYAQTAQVSGFVRDSSGGVVGNASLIIENEATGHRREETSDATGAYTFALLSPGSYRLTIAVPAFKQLTRRGIVLTVGQHARVDVVLDVAAIDDKVTVNAEPHLVNSTGASVGITFDRSMVETLPLNGRSFQSLLALAPGVVGVPGRGTLSANGQRTMSNYFTIDGASANLGIQAVSTGLGQEASGAAPGLSATGGTNTLLSLEAFREVEILTSTFSPENGRTPGAQVSIVTRSGSNNFSGSIFEYFRTSRLDANDWFINKNGIAKPKATYNNFGGVVGGPIHRNHAFFFFSYEGQRLEQPNFSTTSVPTLATRANAPLALRPFLDAYPLPNGRDFGTGLAEFNTSFIRPSDLDSTSIRLDGALNSRHTLFTRFSIGEAANDTRGGPRAQNAMSYFQRDHTRTMTETTGLTSVFSSAMVNDLRVNFSRHRANVTAIMDDFGGAKPAGTDGVVLPGASLSNTDLEVSLYNDLGGLMSQGNLAGAQQRQVQVVDTLSYVVGRHDLKFGADYRRLTPETVAAEQTYTYLFTTIGDALQLRPSRISVGRTSPAEALFENYSFFGQDTFKVSDRLTATYGLRYDINPAPTSRNGTYPLLVANLEDPANLTFREPGATFWPTVWSNVAPRVGVAYRLVEDDRRELVLRAGWGVFFDLGSGRAGNAYGGGYPYRDRRDYLSVPFPPTESMLTPPPSTPTTPGTNTVFAFPANLETPKTQHWNVTLEQALGTNQTVSVGYVGSIGRDLLDPRQYDVRTFTKLAQLVSYLDNSGTSDYHSLQVYYTRRLSHGIQGVASYTWSHAIDTDSSELPSSLPPSDRVSPTSDRGSADFDVRHSLKVALTYRPELKTNNAIVRTLANDWQIDLIGDFRSGLPFNPRYLRDIGFGRLLFRPDLLPGVPIWIDDPAAPGGRRINRDAFQIPQDLRQGNLGRNVIRLPGFSQIDMALSRNLPRFRAIRPSFRIEAFNIFNQTAFGSPVVLLTSSLFGVPTQTLAGFSGPGSIIEGGVNPLHAKGGPRSIQLSLRAQF